MPNTLYSNCLTASSDAVEDNVPLLPVEAVAHDPVEPNSVESNEFSTPSTSLISANATGVLNFTDYLSDDPQVFAAICDATPPNLALSIIESSMTPQQLECYTFCHSKKYDLKNDDTYLTWKKLKLLTTTDLPVPDELDASFASVADTFISVEGNQDLSVTDILYNALLTDPATERSVTAEIPADDVACSPMAENQHVALEDGSNHETRPILKEQLNQSIDQNVIDTQQAISSQANNSSNQANNFPFRNRSYPGDPDADVLPYPPTIYRNKGKAKLKQKYYFLTSKEARDAKEKEVQDRREREAAKTAKQEAKAVRLQSKASKARPIKQGCPVRKTAKRLNEECKANNSLKGTRKVVRKSNENRHRGSCKPKKSNNCVSATKERKEIKD